MSTSSRVLPLKRQATWIRRLWRFNIRDEALISSARLRQLGLIYGVYRFVIASFLVMTNLVLNSHKAGVVTTPSVIEQLSLGLYVAVSLFLLIAFFLFRKKVRTQLFVGFVVDVVFLMLGIIYSQISDFQIILLYMVVIATSYMLLPLNKSNIITVLVVLSILHHQFFHLIFDGPADKDLLSINDSLLLSVSLVAVGFLSWSISQRLAKTEQSLLLHAEEVEKLHAINQAVVKNMVNGIIVLDHDKNIVMINDTAQQMLGLSINEEYGSQAQTLELSRTLIKNHPNLIGWYRSVSAKYPAEFIYDATPQMMSDADDDLVYAVDKLRVSSKPLLDQGQILVIEDLRREQSQAQQLKLASLGQLSASIAHEIRNPLAAISTASELLIEDADDNDVNAEYYQMIYQQTKRVNTIISDVLSLSRQAMPVQSLLDACVWAKQFVDEHYPRESVMVVGEDVPMPFYFDVGHLEQVMTNLINNALRHTIHQFDDSDVKIRLTKTVSGAFIDVLDYGDGVSEQDLPNLFNPFFTTSQKGTGLGLYLSQSFSEANQAKIRYFRENNMSCFRLIVSGAPVSG